MSEVREAATGMMVGYRRKELDGAIFVEKTTSRWCPLTKKLTNDVLTLPWPLGSKAERCAFRTVALEDVRGNRYPIDPTDHFVDRKFFEEFDALFRDDEDNEEEMDSLVHFAIWVDIGAPRNRFVVTDWIIDGQVVD